MYFCKRCNLQVNKSKNICPLCKNKMEKVSKEEQIYPFVNPSYLSKGIFNKLLNITVISSILISLYLNYIISDTISWSVYLVLAVLTIYFSIKQSIKAGYNIYKTLFNEFNLLIIASLIWDYYTGFHKWSINYFIPVLATVFLLFIFVISLFKTKILKKHFGQFLFTIFVGLIPPILLLLNLVNLNYILIGSFVINVYVITFIFVFNIKFIKKELIKRLHI